MITLEELVTQGLLEGPDNHLTDKGRDYLRVLGDLETREISESGEAAADLILSTNGLSR